MPSPRFKRVVALMSLLTVATYLAEPYVVGHPTTNAKPATEFALPTIDGSAFRLSEYNIGTPVLLDFMATWCIPCREQIVQLADLRAKFLPGELVMISIDSEYTLPPSTLDTFRNQTAGVTNRSEVLGWYFAVDTIEEHVALNYGVNALPMLVLIDGSGKVANTWIGLKESPDLQLAIEAVLSAPA
jgi:cytochrome c biogenesis protein CcmG, thiol:disulfide interchange protein DsbE